ncbi:glycosyltransferase [bacterium]|nr:glycosyltransferase [bacterium]
MAKVDLHLHSKYSDRPSEWFLQRLGASLSYTEPEDAYRMAKNHGMDFVTLTDHNTIEGSLRLAEKYEDAFTGLQATTYFPDDGCKIHVLIWDLTEEQFDRIQELRENIFELRDYIHEQGLTHSIAHGLHSINKKLTHDHVEQLVLLFDTFETLTGGMSRRMNTSWYYYLKSLTPEKVEQLRDKHGIDPISNDPWVKGFTGGSDDHGGIFGGKTYTMAGATTAKSFLNAVRAKKSVAKGRSNDFRSLAFQVYKIAVDFSHHQSTKLSRTPTGKMIGHLNDIIFSNQKSALLDNLVVLGLRADSRNRYRVLLAELIEEIRRQQSFDLDKNLDLLYEKIAVLMDEYLRSLILSMVGELKDMDLFAVIKTVSSTLPAMFVAVPFFSSLFALSQNEKLLRRLQSELPTRRGHKILWFTDTITDMNGPSMTLKTLGWRFYSHGIDVKLVSSILPNEMSSDLPPNLINLPCVYDFELPYYTQYVMKVPSLLLTLREVYPFEPDEILISTPGPVGVVGLIVAKLLNVPAIGIYHSDFAMESLEITNDETIMQTVEGYLRWFYMVLDHIKVPTNEYIDILSKRGFAREKMSVFPRMIDSKQFRRLQPQEIQDYHLDLPDGVTMMYIGRVSKDKNLPFLVNVYKEILQELPDLNFVVVGYGPWFEEMKEVTKDLDRIQFTGKVPHDKLPELHAQADFMVFPSTTDTFGMAVLESQAAELPALVSDIGGPKEVIRDGETGWVAKGLDKKEWLDALRRIYKMIEEKPDEYETIRSTARSRAETVFGWEAVLENLSSEVLVPNPIPEVDEG